MPKMHDELFDQIFNKDYYAKKQAVWATPLLGDAGHLAPNYLRIILFGLVSGLIIGLLVFSVLAYKRKLKL